MSGIPSQFAIVGNSSAERSFAISAPSGGPQRVPLYWVDHPYHPFDGWTAVRVEGGFQLKNFTTQRVIGVHGGDLELVCESDGDYKWSIEPAGHGDYKIKVINEDLVWSMINPSKVVLLPADGSQMQLFRLEQLSH